MNGQNGYHPALLCLQLIIAYKPLGLLSQNITIKPELQIGPRIHDPTEDSELGSLYY